MRIIFIIIISILIFIPNTKSIFAVVDPLAAPNNKYGIHIIDENDLYDAANLVNSSGGDWGYVTLVITDKDRNLEKWQKSMELMRNLHLIPIIRIATHLNSDMWEKPKEEDISEWVDFLSRLHWVSKNRYIVLFNEPNHAKEWAGELNPAEYARLLILFSQKLKAASQDFFILPAGLDASAPNGRETMNEEDFLRQMIETRSDVFSYIDGWTSHSYPNPGFRGKVTDSGRGSLQTYKWELDLLKSFGQNLSLPVFITETGWTHEVGLENISRYLKDASESVWSDENIIAITPFILNYQAYPFVNFSWKKPGNNGFFDFYDSYKQITKVAGKPELARVFEKFEGLKIKDFNQSEGDAKVSFPKSFFSFSFWRSLFYGIFKL